MRIPLLVSVVTLAIALVTLTGCPLLPDTCNELNQCVDGSTSVFDGGGDQAHPEAGSGDATIQDGNAGDATGKDTGPSCNTALTPAESACVIADGLAIFVAPTGSSSNPGTMEAPVATLAEGIALAAATSMHRVIACAGTYTESVSLTGGEGDGGIDVTGGLGLFSGVACPGNDAGDAPWSYTGTKAVVAPAAHGYALAVSGITATIDVEDFEFDSQAGTGPGESSIAGFVSSSPNLTLRRVKLAAGAGANGANGALTPVMFPTAAQLEGSPGSPGLASDGGGPGCSFTCPAGGTTTGGTGGAGGAPNGNDGTAGVPALGGGAAGTAAQCAATTPIGGQSGSAASPSADSAGASALGSLSPSNQWVPASGTPGTSGGPGQGGGGGGGGGAADGIGGGGGGGCGGCGGAGGGPGGGGGASIALLVLGSTSSITLDTCELVASNAGAGGAGIAAQAGQTPGGQGGSASASGGCQGGRGGAGGAGGAGGGGAGGISVGVLYQGSLPAMLSTTPTVAPSPADGGPAADGSSNAGISGTSAAEMSIP